MVTIKKKAAGGKAYYYLQHTVRTMEGVQTREKYLGARMPAKLDELKIQFLAEIYQERWYPILEGIREDYAKEGKKLPPSALAKQIRTFSVKFTYDTNRMEGSKLTYRETADLLERGLTPHSKPVDDIKEAESHEKLFYEMLDFKKDLSLQTVLYWHKKLFEPTKPDIAGKIRQHQVGISGSRFMPPSPVEVPVLLDGFFRWYAKNKGGMHPVELAACVHLKLVSIHPFGDGNGRMGRLLMNFVLQRHGFPMLNIPYENRGGYYHALERSQVKKTDSIFTQWFFRRYAKENRNYGKRGGGLCGMDNCFPAGAFSKQRSISASSSFQCFFPNSAPFPPAAPPALFQFGTSLSSSSNGAEASRIETLPDVASRSTRLPASM